MSSILNTEDYLNEEFYDVAQTPEEELELLEKENKMLQKYFDEYSSNIKNLKDVITSCEGKTRTLQDEINRKQSQSVGTSMIKKEEVPITSTLDPKYEKYEIMKKKGVPQGGIKQKMQTDNIPENEIDDILLILFPDSKGSVKNEIPKAPEKSFWKQQDRSKYIFKKTEKKIVEPKKTGAISPRKEQGEFEKNVTGFINSLKLNIFNFYKLDKLIFTKKVFTESDYEKLLNIILSNVSKKDSSNIVEVNNKFQSILPDIRKSLPNKDKLLNLLSDSDKLKPIFDKGFEKYLKDEMNNNLDILKIYKLFYNYILDYNKKSRIDNIKINLDSWNLHLEKFQKGYFDNKDNAKIYCEELINKRLPKPIKIITKQQKNASTVSTSRKKAEELSDLDTNLNILINNDIFMDTVKQLIFFCDSSNTLSIGDFIKTKILIFTTKLASENFLKNLVEDNLSPILKLGIAKNKNNIDDILDEKNKKETIFVNEETIQFIKFFYDPNKFTLECIKINESVDEIVSRFDFISIEIKNLNDFLKILDGFKDNFSILILVLVAYYIKDKDKPPEFYTFSQIDSEILASEKGKFISIFINSLPEIIQVSPVLLSTNFINNIQQLSEFKINYKILNDYVESFNNSYKVLKINVDNLINKTSSKSTSTQKIGSLNISKDSNIKSGDARANLLATLKLRGPVDSGEPPAFLAGITSKPLLKKQTTDDKKLEESNTVEIDPLLIKYKEYAIKELEEIKNKYNIVDTVQRENSKLIKNIFDFFGEDTKNIKPDNINIIINVIIKISKEYFKQYNISKDMLLLYLKEIGLNPDGNIIKRRTKSKRRISRSRRRRTKSKRSRRRTKSKRSRIRTKSKRSRIRTKSKRRIRKYF